MDGKEFNALLNVNDMFYYISTHSIPISIDTIFIKLFFKRSEKDQQALIMFQGRQRKGLADQGIARDNSHLKMAYLNIFTPDICPPISHCQKSLNMIRI